jgi:putative addiction module component (TIGR02574 family)
MSMTVDEIVAEARQLPPGQIGDLFDWLLAESFAVPTPEADAAWRTEVRRRLAEMDSGAVTGVPAERVMAELREIAGS